MNRLLDDTASMLANILQEAYAKTGPASSQQDFIQTLNDQKPSAERRITEYGKALLNAWQGPIVGSVCIYVCEQIVGRAYSDLPLVNSWLLSYLALHNWCQVIISMVIGFGSGVFGGTVSEFYSTESGNNAALAWIGITSGLIFMHIASGSAASLTPLDLGVSSGCYLVRHFVAVRHRHVA